MSELPGLYCASPHVEVGRTMSGCAVTLLLGIVNTEVAYRVALNDKF